MSGFWVFCFCFVWFCFWDSFSVITLVVLNSLCRPGWPGTHVNPPASVLGLKVYTTLFNFIILYINIFSVTWILIDGFLNMGDIWSFRNRCCCTRWWQYTPLVPAEAGVSLWVWVWSIEWFPGQPCTQRNPVLKNQKEKKGRKKEMRLSMISVLVWRGHIFKWIKLKTRLPAGQWCHRSLIPDVPGRVQGLLGQNLVSKSKQKTKKPKTEQNKIKKP